MIALIILTSHRVYYGHS